MRALLDTNIIIHREARKIVNLDIGTLFKWLDKANYEKCIHPITVKELQKHKDKVAFDTLNIKLQSYSELKTVAPLANAVEAMSAQIDINENDRNDTLLLNEVFNGRVDILVSEDKGIHKKASLLGIHNQVFKIDGFLEKVVSENPKLVDYNVLSVDVKHFGDINLRDSFFDSFRLDYIDFDQWFNKKADEIAYVTHNRGNILSFLYLKIEEPDENYADIAPVFDRKRRLKIGTFKVVSNGLKLGERFLKIIFDNAVRFQVGEIYVTIFDKNEDQLRLIDLLMKWGFIHHGFKKTATGNELVFCRDFNPNFNPSHPQETYPYIGADKRIFLCPIYPQYHTELLPDSILTSESPHNYSESLPHRNAITKVYISRSINRNLSAGDLIVFYRTGGYYKSVVTTVGIVESIDDDIENEDDFILKCRKRSIFPDVELKKHWSYSVSNRPFIVNFLYAYSLPKRLNLAKLIELGIIADAKSAPRGFEPISKEQFLQIIRESKSNESIIVD